jgi:hypothetical protein
MASLQKHIRMKPIFLSLLALLFTNALLAQDNIVLRNGEEIKAKVQEVGTTEIKYWKADNLNGPLYVVLKSDVFIIKYENGTKEVFGSAEDAHAAPPKPEINDEAEFRDRRVREDRRRPARQPRTHYQNDQKAATKKIVGGAIMTGLGLPLLAGGSALLSVGIPLTYPNSGSAVGGAFSVMFIGAGSVLLAGGIVLEVLGPITLSRGIKARKGLTQGSTLNFTPIYNPALDKYNMAINRQTIGAVTFIF